MLWPGVQYRTGQAFDCAKSRARRTHAARIAGFDLAHAVGNLPLQLHDSGRRLRRVVPLQVPELRAGRRRRLLRARAPCAQRAAALRGLVGTRPGTRFRMGPEFLPDAGRRRLAVQQSADPRLAPLRASLELFRARAWRALRAKSLRLTGYLERADPRTLSATTLQIVTPREPERRGCQLSLRVAGGRARGRALFDASADHGVLGDWREPDVIRISPAPLYNRFATCCASSTTRSPRSRRLLEPDAGARHHHRRRRSRRRAARHPARAARLAA